MKRAGVAVALALFSALALAAEHGGAAHVAVAPAIAPAPAIAWHGRLMVAAWVIALPIGVLVARFFKVLPSQDWPRELDHQFWWRSHLVVQSTGAALTIAALLVIPWFDSPGGAAMAVAHRVLGWAVIGLLAVQLLGGAFRGTKGGPRTTGAGVVEPGDHYLMTRRRVVFEVLHKCAGYLAIALAVVNVVLGLSLAGAPGWMWALIGAWWLGMLVAAAVLQGRGRCIDTYQAIWGPAETHPGNQRRPLGPGIRRLPGS